MFARLFARKVLVFSAIASAGGGCLAFAGADEVAPAPAAEGEHIAAARQALSTYVGFMTGLAPVAWYKFDEASGTVAADSSGNGHDGTYVYAAPSYADGTPMLSASGAVNDNSTASHYGTYVPSASPYAAAPMSGSTYPGAYMTVPTNSDFSLTKVADNFGRSAPPSSGWGAPSTGLGAWQWVVSSGSYYGVTAAGGSSAAGATIDESTASGTFGQSLSAQPRLDTDTQVDVSWASIGAATTTQGTFEPLLLTARFADSNDYYGARLTESNGTIELGIVKKQPGALTHLTGGDGDSVTLATTYDPSVQWRVRFQIESDRSTTPTKPTLRAKVWKVGTTQPLAWTMTVTDPGTPLPAGLSAILSSNSSTDNRSIVTYANYRLQSTGLTVSTWMRPTTETFVNPSGSLCTGGVDANYVKFVSKSAQVNGVGNAEWALRHYPETAIENDAICVNNRRWAVSAYAYSAAATASNPSNQGAGDRFNPASTLVGVWHHVVGIYDPGDSTDLAAGVAICVDGTCFSKTATDGSLGKGTNYADPAYLVDPAAGTAPLLVGAGASGAWQQFQGDIDELSIYDYRLTPKDVADMYAFKK